MATKEDILEKYTMTRAEAVEQGYIIHSHVYPNMAHKDDGNIPIPVPTKFEDGLYIMARANRKLQNAFGVAREGVVKFFDTLKDHIEQAAEKD